MKKKKIDLLVLSDRYPPHSVGGAELSLHAILRRVPKCKSLVVISVYSNNMYYKNYDYEGIDVIQLEMYPQFPFHSMEPAVYKLANKSKKLMSFYKKKLARQYYQKYKLYDIEKDDGHEFMLKYGSEKNIFEEAYTLNHIKNICKNLDVDTLHADNFRSIALSQEINARKKVYTIRDNRFHENNIQEGLNDTQMNLLMSNSEYRLSLLDTADIVTVTSKHLLDNLIRVKPNINYIRIPNPADEIDDSNYLSENINNEFNIVIIGMLNENKGQVQFIKALRKQIKANPDIKINLVGKGERIERRIREICNESNIKDQVILHGYLSREETYRLINSSQVVVLPTMWEEPFGRVPLEAGIMSKPVVAFAVGGLKETIINGTTGFLVDKGNFNEMFKKIILLKKDEELSTKMGFKAKEHINKNYNVKKIANDYFNIWKI
ncbi:glycosyltransferase family 4 protein [Psychrobacter celer]|uniref:glycosyltransferase family 4 protein n=1 Tax=Psychrobacter celer TaxID=306572 RepID=UPI003FCFB3C9